MKKSRKNASRIKFVEPFSNELDFKRRNEIIFKTSKLTDQRLAMNGCGGFPLPTETEGFTLQLKRLVKKLGCNIRQR